MRRIPVSAFDFAFDEEPSLVAANIDKLVTNAAKSVDMLALPVFDSRAAHKQWPVARSKRHVICQQRWQELVALSGERIAES